MTEILTYLLALYWQIDYIQAAGFMSAEAVRAAFPCSLVLSTVPGTQEALSSYRTKEWMWGREQATTLVQTLLFQCDPENFLETVTWTGEEIWSYITWQKIDNFNCQSELEKSLWIFEKMGPACRNWIIQALVGMSLWSARFSSGLEFYELLCC